MLRYGLHILLALAGLLLQTTLLSQIWGDSFKPDLAFLVVIYLGLHRPMSEATPAVVVIAYLADRFTALPDGTFLLLYVALFYLASGTSKVFYFRGTGFPALMTFALSMLYGIGLSVMVGYGKAAASSDTILSQARIPWGFLFLFSLVNVLFSALMFRVCRIIDRDGNIRGGQRAVL